MLSGSVSFFSRTDMRNKPKRIRRVVPHGCSSTRDRHIRFPVRVSVSVGWASCANAHQKNDSRPNPKRCFNDVLLGTASLSIHAAPCTLLRDTQRPLSDATSCVCAPRKPDEPDAKACNTRRRTDGPYVFRRKIRSPRREIVMHY